MVWFNKIVFGFGIFIFFITELVVVFIDDNFLCEIYYLYINWILLLSGVSKLDSFPIET